MRIERDNAGRAWVDRPGTDGGPVAVGHVVCVAKNYPAHAAEMTGANPVRPGHPAFFAKNPASVALHGEDIVIPMVCQRQDQVDYEGELAIVLGQDCKDLLQKDALAVDGPVLGACCANDVSARWWQRKGAGGQFYRGKSFDTFCPIGPAVTPLADAGDLENLSVRTKLNGETVQDASTAEMFFGTAAVLAAVTAGATLRAGSVVLTGTPAGVGVARDPQRFLKQGDQVVVEVGSLGRLCNRVRLG